MRSNCRALMVGNNEKLSLQMATPENLDSILQINNQHYDKWNRTEFDNLFNSELGFLTLNLEEQIIGYTVYHCIFDEFKIINLTLDKNFHGMGYAKQMLDYVLQLATASNLRWAMLNVRTGNQPAIRLYLKTGFNILGKRNNYYTNLTYQDDAYLMQKDLQQPSMASVSGVAYTPLNSY